LRQSRKVRGGNKNMHSLGSNKIKTPMWTKTIFACFCNKALEKALVEAAKEINCEICWGEAHPDIIAFSYFVAIIDRKILGKKAWALFVRFAGEVIDLPPCILLDEKGVDKSIKSVRNVIFYKFNLKGKTSVVRIVSLIKKIKAYAERNKHKKEKKIEELKALFRREPEPKNKDILSIIKRNRIWDKRSKIK